MYSGVGQILGHSTGTGFMEASNAEVSSGVWGHDSPEFHYWVS